MAETRRAHKKKRADKRFLFQCLMSRGRMKVGEWKRNDWIRKKRANGRRNNKHSFCCNVRLLDKHNVLERSHLLLLVGMMISLCIHKTFISQTMNHLNLISRQLCYRWHWSRLILTAFPSSLFPPPLSFLASFTSRIFF